MKNMENLNNNPRLKYLLSEYVKIQYESQADTSEDLLIREYNLLKSTNRLDDLWEMERMLSRWEKMKIDSDNRTLIEEPKIFDAARNLSYILKSRSI